MKALCIIVDSPVKSLTFIPGIIYRAEILSTDYVKVYSPKVPAELPGFTTWCFSPQRFAKHFRMVE